MKLIFVFILNIIQVLWIVETTLGNIVEFLENLPRKVQHAFESTWKIIQKNLEIPIRPPRYGHRLRYTLITDASTSPTLGDYDSFHEYPELSTIQTPELEMTEKIRPVIPVIIPRQPKWAFAWRMPLPVEESKHYAPVAKEEDTTHRVKYYLKKKENVLYSIPIIEKQRDIETETI